MVWGAFVGLTGALAGDGERALRASRACLEADPDMTFSFLSVYARIIHGWATTMAGDHDTGIAEMQAFITVFRGQSTRSGEHSIQAVLADALLAAGRIDEADEALVAAAQSIVLHGQNYAEPLILLLRAQVHHARGGTPPEVRTLIGRARAMACEREAFLYARRADEFEATLTG